MAGLFDGLYGMGGGGTQQDPSADARMAMMAQLLQGGGYSPNRTSFGQIMGQALMAGQAARQQAIKLQQARDSADIEKRYKEAQIQHLQDPRSMIGNYQPGDYTPDSWANFLAGGQQHPEVLVRYVSPRNDTSNPYISVQRTLPDGSTQLGKFDKKSGTYQWDQVVVPPGQKALVDAQGAAQGTVQGNVAGDIQKKGSNAAVVKGLVGDARKILADDSTTGSALGAAGDALGGVVGYSTHGAQNTAKLRVIQSGLMMNMPRMEGPQSDRDVQLYQQAAAQLSDSTVPTATRAAALDTIEAIQNRYMERAADAAPNSAAVKPAKGSTAQPRELTYDPATGTFK